jgi:hypothetical protein
MYAEPNLDIHICAVLLHGLVSPSNLSGAFLLRYPSMIPSVVSCAFMFIGQLFSIIASYPLSSLY